MASLPDLPGKGLIVVVTRQTRAVATAAGAGALALGGFVLKRVLGHDDAEPEPNADPIAETPTAPPGAEKKSVPGPKRKPAKSKAAKPGAAEAKGAAEKASAADEPSAASKPKAGLKPKASAKPKADPKPKVGRSADAGPGDAAKREATPKAGSDTEPPRTTGTDAPPKPEAEPGNISGDKDPHSALSNPVVEDPDLTEYPDPYETREDPRDPDDPDHAPFGEEPHPQTGAESTSEPPPSQDPEVGDRAKPPRRENLDE